MKTGRQQKILDIINSREIETQEELGQLLSDAGFSVTQATVSRDIRELRLVKVAGRNGRQVYASTRRDAPVDNVLSDTYLRVFAEGFVSADTAQNILVIKTVSGMAMAVAASVDAMQIDEIVGSIAGDDTILCAVRTAADAKNICRSLEKLAGR
ncbi:MAG: arginine repressor [Eubacterium sp.]|nr:arginine repressor [Eubacterium sp.]